MTQTYPCCQFNLLQGELLPFVKHQQHQCLEKWHLQLLFALFQRGEKRFHLTEFAESTRSRITESVIYLFKFGLQNTMAECRLPLKLPAAMFAQVKCLEDLLQSHHLDNDTFFFFTRKPPLFCTVHYNTATRFKKVNISLVITSGGRCTSMGTYVGQ